jgi:hypothetical protein
MKWVDDRERSNPGAFLARSIDQSILTFERWVRDHPTTFAIAIMLLFAVWVTVVALDRTNAIENNPPGNCTAATRADNRDDWTCIRFEGQ